MIAVPRRRRVRVISVIVGAVALAAIVAAPAQAKAGGAEYEYKVRVFDYFVEANVFGDQAPDQCVSGVSSFWGALVELDQGDLISPVTSSAGHLEIGRRGSSGTIEAEADFDFDFTGVHNLTTDCEAGTDSESTCEETRTVGVAAHGLIEGSVGDKLKVNWSFRQVDLSGHWTPDNFVCEELMPVAHDSCKSKVPLKTMTKRKFNLRFLCSAVASKPPPGTGWSSYSSTAFAHGYLAMKRVRQN